MVSMFKLILFFLLIITGKGYATEFTLINHTGSYSGALTLGLGIGTDSKSYRCEFIAGYTPATLAGEDLYSLTNKHTFVLTNPRSPVRLFSGLGVVTSIHDDDTYYKLPSKYPRKYYPPTGYYFLPYFGIEIGNATNVYFEVATLDYYAELMARGEGEIGPHEVFTYGFGLRSRIN